LILLALGRVVAKRKRSRDAYRLLGEALEAAIDRDDDDAQAAVHRAVAELRTEDSNQLGAVAALTSAVDILSKREGRRLELAQAALELASALVRGPVRAAAQQALQRARDLAIEAGAPYLEAKAAATAARLHETLGEAKRAAESWSSARACAARAGDAAGTRRYQRAQEGERAAVTEVPGIV
jgi:hypothetical protein